MLVAVATWICAAPGSQVWAQEPAPLPPDKAALLVETITLELGPDGFTPSAIDVPRKRFFLHVRNLLPTAKLTLALERDSSGRVLDRVLDFSKRKHFDEAILLPPGTYVLRVVERPEWRATLVVNR
jgi:hypothetical protein